MDETGVQMTATKLIEDDDEFPEGGKHSPGASRNAASFRRE